MPPPAAKCVLITGASGFLGGAVAQELHAQGWHVMATGRRNAIAAWRDRGIEYVPCDLAVDSAALKTLAKGCHAIVHCAALTSPWGRRRDFVDANETATRNVIVASLAESVTRLVHISSPSVAFDFTPQRNLREDAPWNARPANGYIATKRNAELLVRQAVAQQGLPAIILRPKAMIGPGDTSVLPRVMQVARRGTFPLFGGDDPPLDLTWIGDAVAAVRLALEAPPAHHGKIYHITSGDPLPRSLSLQTLFDACGLPVRFHTWSLRRAMAAAGALELASRCCTAGRWEPLLTRYSTGLLAYGQTLDITAARRDLGYSPAKKILEALQECGERWRSEYPLK